MQSVQEISQKNECMKCKAEQGSRYCLQKIVESQLKILSRLTVKETVLNVLRNKMSPLLQLKVRDQLLI